MLSFTFYSIRLLFQSHVCYRLHGILQARILEWVAFPIFTGPSQPRSPALQVYSLPLTQKGSPRILDVYPIPSPADLPRPGLTSGYPALQVDSLPTELSRKPLSSIQLSPSVMSNLLWPHGLQHNRLPCPAPTPRASSNSCPSSQWCHPTISSSVIPFSSCLQSSQHQGLFQWVSSLHQVAKVLELQHQSFQWIFKVDFL